MTIPTNQTLLAIRMRQLGDVLATLGTLRAIKRAVPEQRIVFLVDGRYHALVGRAPYIDELFPEPPGFTGVEGAGRFQRYVEKLRGLRVDRVLDFHSNSRSALLSYLSGAPVRVGFDVRVRKVFYTDVEPRAVFRNRRRMPRTSHESAMDLARRSGVEGLAGSVHNTLPVSEAEQTRGRRLMLAVGVPADALASRAVVAINPGNPYPAKTWPRGNFVELARRLVAQNKTVVVWWGPGEKAVAEEIVRHAGRGAVLGPALELSEIPGCLRHSAFVVTIDSGLKHLAVAIGVPTVTLFGPTSPDEWHMGGEYDRVVSSRVSCSPCRLHVCPIGTPCMNDLTPDTVMREVAVIESSAGVL